MFVETAADFRFRLMLLLLLIALLSVHLPRELASDYIFEASATSRGATAAQVRSVDGQILLLCVFALQVTLPVAGVRPAAREADQIRRQINSETFTLFLCCSTGGEREKSGYP